MGGSTYVSSYDEWLQRQKTSKTTLSFLWAARISATVSDVAAPLVLAETLYLAFADVAVVRPEDKELFSFFCAASSEFALEGREADCARMLVQAQKLSGHAMSWLRAGCAAIRTEMARRGVAHPRD